MGLSDCRVEALLAVSDLDRAKRFYERQLGLVPGEAEDDGVALSVRARDRDQRLSLGRERRQITGDACGLVR